MVCQCPLNKRGLPAFEDHLDPALSEVSATLFAHVERSKDMLPSMRVQLQ